MINLTPWKKRAADVKVTKVPSFEDSQLPGFNRSMEDLFRNFFHTDLGSLWEGTALPGLFQQDADVAPSMDLVETEDAFKLSAELPGMDEHDVEVLVEGSYLRLRGEKKHEEETKREGYHVMERSYGHIERTVPLPDGVDLDHVKATFKKGVLQVDLPKTEPGRSTRRTINVTAE